MKLTDDIDRWYKLHSIQLAGLGIVLLGAWQALPDDLKSDFPPQMTHYIAYAMFGLVIVGRLIKQNAPQQDTEHERRSDADAQ